ncbi:undecaprenyl-diphosphate phosphatase [Lentibacillus kapialis]|uniref:undecaprenyl-diphosphate phosphatase n=1 Tax=Lentibacillus kapialis TaxID=340214 RepID=UPI0016685E01|nr:undecaprenyl-diphosphate phosphatase [Lentibacillus kapialis]
MEAFWVLIKYIILGLLQGFTEPIPISSSGHLVIVRELFGIGIDGLSFEIMVNFGSLIAVLVIYRKDIYRLVENGIRYITTRANDAKSDFQFVMFLILATIPTGIIGLLFEDFIERQLGGRVVVVGVALLITGAALWIIRNLRGNKGEGSITVLDAIIVGLAQSVALVPGISRSGATIVAAMLVGMKTETALRFSFLLYIPVSLGITMLSAGDLIGGDSELSAVAIPSILAFAAAIIATYYSLRWFMNVMARGNLKYFAYYCFAVGVLVILFL